MYQGKCAIYCGWYRYWGLSPVGASVQQVADFLIFLRREKRLSVSAIKGSRTALSTVLQMKDVDLSSSWETSVLLKSF